MAFGDPSRNSRSSRSPRSPGARGSSGGPPSRGPSRSPAGRGPPRATRSERSASRGREADRPHPPSQARAIIQEAKSGRGRDLPVLLKEAEAIEDPSFAAEAVFALTTDPRMMTAEAVRKLDDVVRLLDLVERPWRRAEAISDVARRTRTWRERIGGKSAQAQAQAGRDALLQRLTDLVLALKEGEARSAGIQNFAGYAHAARLPDLLAAALGNGSHAPEDAKAVLRAAVEQGGAAVMAGKLQAHPDPTQRARLLGALHVQVAKHDASHAAAILDHALAAVATVPDQAERVEVVRGLIASATDTVSLHRIAAAAAGEPVEPKARMLSAVGGRADKLGAKAEARVWLDEALAAAGEIADAKARANVTANVQAGLARLSGESAPVSVPRASAPTSLREATRADAPAAPPVAPTAPTVPERADPHSPLPVAPVPKGRAPSQTLTATGAKRHVLALCDTYEGGLGDVHLRAVARAAPLCIAFGLDLALLGFPAADAAEIVTAVEAESNIGEGGRYVERLADEGRLLVVPCTTKEPPADWTPLGFAVATTPQPDPRKASGLEQAVAAAASAGAGRLCVLMGLGKRGLPPSYMRLAPTHVELTGQGISMETATAMGVLAERMRLLPAVAR